MPHGSPHFGTEITPQPEIVKSKEHLECEAKGGEWDLANRICILPEIPVEDITFKGTEKPPRVKPDVLEVGEIQGSAKQTAITSGGRQFFGLSKPDIAKLAQQQSQLGLPPGTEAAGTAQRRADIQFQGQQLAGQVGQFGQLPISPTGLDFGEAATTGVISSIPSALRLAGQAGIGAAVVGGAVAGAKAGVLGAPATGGISIAAGAAIGAGVGLIAGIVGGMTSNFKSQRTDTTTAQQRVLDEGKQTLMDWVTLARTDPSNRMFYLAQFNNQLAQIDQAFRNMKLDTSRDLAKFETSIPNLEEFNTFYSVGGERDALKQEMINALTAVPPEGYSFFELAERRKKDNDTNI